jgi:hypothetical protein
VVKETNTPLNGFPRLKIGSKPIDGGHYIFTESERDEFLQLEPGATQFMRPYIGSREFLDGERRYILCLQQADPGTLNALPRVRERIQAVREFRHKSESAPTRAIANTPTLFHVNVLPEEPFLVLPKVSSERREWLPIGWLEPPTVPSDLLFVLPDATKAQFALLTSAMHMAWLRHVGGRLESRYRYSIGLVYNPFPTPTISADQSTALESLTDAVLEARDGYPSTSLSDLYDPDLMPPELRRAHDAVDKAVDRLYTRTGFSSERERIEHLFHLYERLVSPLSGQADAGRGRTRRGSARSQPAD